MNSGSMHAVAWKEIADRVLVLRYRFFDQTIGVVAGDDGLLVIDTRTSLQQGRELLDDIRRLAPLPVRVVVNTHRHSDHCFGNRVFRPASIWGHVRCAEGLVETGPAQQQWLIESIPDQADDWRAVAVDPPDRTFRHEARLSLGGRMIELRYLGRGHTDGDIIVSVPDAAVVFAGDLLENGAPPSYGDAFPIEWPDTAAAILPFATGSVVPGHGEPADRAFAESQVAELRATADLVRQVASGELSAEAAETQGPFGPETTRLAIRRGLAELTGRPGEPPTS